MFVNGPIIITAVLNALTELRDMIVQNPSVPLLSNATIKGYIDQGCSYQVTEAAKRMRGDMEVYQGFFLIPMALTGQAGWMSILTYWQLTRMRYMISVHLQAAWVRFDQ